MEEQHTLNSFTGRCWCGDKECKEWKAYFKKPGEEDRCPRCQALKSWHELESGQLVKWCLNCSLAIP